MVFPETIQPARGKAVLIKTVLNKVERFKSFVYGPIGVQFVDGVEALVIDIEARLNNRPVCPECECKGVASQHLTLVRS
jgi:hypothetical protein